MITLYTFGPAFGLPDPSPFVMKTEMLLKLSGLPYQTDSRGFMRAPKGKLPYINDNGTIVADSTFIRLYLENRHSIYFDRGLTERDRGIAWALEKMCEDHLYWLLIYWRWLIDANFNKGPKKFFRRAPAIVRPFVERAVRRKIRKTMWLHGLGRHTEQEMAAVADRAVLSLSQILGNNTYAFGSEPCGADATLFAFVASALTPYFDSPVRASFEKAANLVAYRDRMMTEFYGVRPHFQKAVPQLPGSS